MSSENLESKAIVGSGAALVVSSTHALLCPAHGVLPLAGKIAAGSGSALASHELIGPLAWVHEKEVAIADACLDYLLPGESHHECERHVHTTEFSHNHGSVHPHAEALVSGVTYFSIVLSAAVLLNSLRKRYYHRCMETCSHQTYNDA